MPPNRVRFPVATTSAITVPETIDEPKKTMCGACGSVLAGAEGSAFFVDRKGFTGECCLLDGEMARLEEASIGWNEITRVQANDVSGDQFPTRQFLPLPIAQDRRSGHKGCVQLLDRLLRTIGLEEIDGRAGQDDTHDERRIHELTEQGRDRGGYQEHHRQGLEEEACEVHQSLAPPGQCRFVRAEPAQPIGRRAAAETFPGGKRSVSAARS